MSLERVPRRSVVSFKVIKCVLIAGILEVSSELYGAYVSLK